MRKEKELGKDGGRDGCTDGVLEEGNMAKRSEETEVQVERTTEEVCNEDERCEEEASESHSTV